MKIVITDFPDVLKRDIGYEIRLIQDGLPGGEVEVVPFEERASWLSRVRDADAILTAFLKIDGEVMDQIPKLKCIALNATGYDSIRIEDAAKRNIAVIPVIEYCTREVADHTMALILALERGLKHYEADIDRDKRWQYSTLSRIHRIEGQTLGICGFGKIGKAVARRAQAFEMKVIVYSPHCNKEVARQYGVERTDIDGLLEKSDVISNHMAQSAANYHFFDEDKFRRMARRPFFINVSRGSAVDERALVSALDRGQIAGAGLDVLTEENPDLHHCGLTNRENVILTPHAAFYSIESMEDLQTISCQNLIQYLQQNP